MWLPISLIFLLTLPGTPDGGSISEPSDDATVSDDYQPSGDLLMEYDVGHTESAVPTSTPASEKMSKTPTPLLLSPDFDPEWIEDEILRIRTMWQLDRDGIDNGTYNLVSLDSDTDAYFDQGQLKMIEIELIINGVHHTKIYQFEDGRLVFAYIAGDGEQNRLYFYNDILFRWRHTPDKNNPSDFIDYNSDPSAESFVLWQETALNEAYKLYESIGD